MQLKRKMKGIILEGLFIVLVLVAGTLVDGRAQVVEVTAPTYASLKAPTRRVAEPLKGEKICYLTFDDGPSSNTEAILDILKEYDAKATFFVIGNELTEETKEILTRMKEEGHSIGLHANNHSYQQFYASTESLLTDYEQLFTTLKNEYGIETALFRFPGGSACTYLRPNRQTCLEELRQRGFSCFDWQISGEDAVGSPTVGSILKSIFPKVYDYDTPIILLHDGRGRTKTVEALPEILKELQEKGYRCSALENAPEYTYRVKE